MSVRRIGFLGFDGVQALDLVGPSDAFQSDAFDAPALQRGRAQARPYEVVVIGLRSKSFTAGSGVRFEADVTTESRVQLDTLIIPGGKGLRRPGVADMAAAWIAKQAPRVRRIASVCTGLYGLAPTGLLDGQRVTTHWAAIDDIGRRFPKLKVDPDALFIRAGKFYTSAGVSAGIDLALALIEEDLGPQAAIAVAREMVVYVKRPGGQNQFSEPLRFQSSFTDRFKELAAWIPFQLRSDLSVDAMARRACLSVRHFARVFKSECGMTPARFVEEARLAEASRRLLESRRLVNVEVVARSVGYSNPDTFRRAFERRFGVAPGSYRERFSPSTEHP